jgi:hypothetical protein
MRGTTKPQKIQRFIDDTRHLPQHHPQHNDIDIKRVEKYEYLGVVLNNSMNYDAQCDVTSSEPTLTYLKKLRRMGFTEDKLVCIYKSSTLSQYIYGAPLLASASTRAKKEMQAQQRRFLHVIGISTEKAL